MIDIKHSINTITMAKQNEKPNYIRGKLIKATCDQYRIMFNDSYAIEFLNLIYKDNSICLDRKYNKYLDAKQIWLRD